MQTQVELHLDTTADARMPTSWSTLCDNTADAFNLNVITPHAPKQRVPPTSLSCSWGCNLRRHTLRTPHQPRLGVAVQGEHSVVGAPGSLTTTLFAWDMANSNGISTLSLKKTRHIFRPTVTPDNKVKVHIDKTADPYILSVITITPCAKHLLFPYIRLSERRLDGVPCTCSSPPSTTLLIQSRLPNCQHHCPPQPQAHNISLCH